MMEWRDYDDVNIESVTETKGGYLHLLRYEVTTSDGTQFERNERNVAIALGTLFEQFGDVDVIEGREAVPVKVAVEGRPAIATYLRGVHGMSKSEIGEKMGVTEDTVRKYITRFRPYTDS